MVATIQRRARGFGVIALLALGGTAAFGAGGGCSSDCEDTATCDPAEDTTTSSTSTSSSPTTSSSSGDGGSPSTSTGEAGSSSTDGGGGAAGTGGSGGDGGGGSNPGCELVEGQTVGAQCGIFVNAGAARDGDGSQGSPRNSLAAALADATDGDTVYVCTSATPVADAISLATSVALVGGLDCEDWVWSADTLTSWGTAADAIPLRVTGATTEASLRGFAIEAADASTPGGSSIAVLVHEAALDIVGCAIEAKDGAPGVDAVRDGAPAIAMAGISGENGCLGGVGVIGGGGGGQNTCQGSNRNGGLGGSGTNDLTLGGNANPGSPLGDGGGVAGQGEGFATCGTGGTGGDGTPGTTSAAGPGAPDTADGTLSAAGFSGAPGSPGTTTGTPGAGGGGGGGANQCLTGPGGSGPSGGGGGAGGCGGNVGSAGEGGGSSFALVVVDSTNVTLANTELFAGDAGRGGNGAAGQRGQVGGDGGNPGVGGGACSGGRGGNGGEGGSGGGGRGGHSAAIAHTGAAPTVGDGVSFARAKAGGPGGAGGVGDQAGNTGGNGAPGEAADVIALPAG